mmetsp:Transcript_30092/g.94888  ORF Transcript_30092/g.94888 Transcript_30092/m.94888 type:complete len:244 (-) Transcript_30092:105-836(-)
MDSSSGASSSGSGPAARGPGRAAPKDFSAWAMAEQFRRHSTAWRRLVDKQLLAWLCVVRVLSRRHRHYPSDAGALSPSSTCSGCDGSSSAGASGSRRQRRSTRSVLTSEATGAGPPRPGRAPLPRLARDLVCEFVGDQTGAGITAQSLRRRVDAVRLQDLWSGLLPELGKAADQGMMNYHLNQRIEQLAFWRPWMLEPDGPQWIRTCLEDRGLRVDVCKVYHTAYAGVQGCSFFELKVCWSGC